MRNPFHHLLFCRRFCRLPAEKRREEAFHIPKEQVDAIFRSFEVAARKRACYIHIIFVVVDWPGGRG